MASFPDYRTDWGCVGTKALSLRPVGAQVCGLRSPLTAGVHAALPWRPRGSGQSGRPGRVSVQLRLPSLPRPAQLPSFDLEKRINPLGALHWMKGQGLFFSWWSQLNSFNLS